MARVEVRPHFELHVPLPPDVVADRLRRAVGVSHAVTGDVLNRHAQITIPAAKRHLWSPWLSFEIEEPEGQEEKGGPGGHTRLLGMFLPHPNVWTFYVALLAVSLFVALGGLMWGSSQWMAGESAWALWLVPAGLVAAVGLYVGAFLGQRLGADEMDVIRAFVGETLGVEVPSPAALGEPATDAA
jgi:hypothetical protein